jgi:hypothetical protein
MSTTQHGREAMTERNHPIQPEPSTAKLPAGEYMLRAETQGRGPLYTAHLWISIIRDVLLIILLAVTLYFGSQLVHAISQFGDTPSVSNVEELPGGWTQQTCDQAIRSGNVDVPPACYQIVD